MHTWTNVNRILSTYRKIQKNTRQAACACKTLVTRCMAYLCRISLATLNACDVLLDVYRRISRINKFIQPTFKGKANARLFLYFRFSISKSFVKMSNNHTGISDGLEEGSVSYLSHVVHYSTLTKQVQGEERGRGLGKRNYYDWFWRLHGHYTASSIMFLPLLFGILWLNKQFPSKFWRQLIVPWSL